MTQSTIRLDISLDNNKVCEDIRWNASDTSADTNQQAKAMMLALWDRGDKTALRIDLWTKDMMIDEMGDFFYQTYMTMADTFGRATQNPALVDEMKKFAIGFQNKFQEWLISEHKVS